MCSWWRSEECMSVIITCSWWRSEDCMSVVGMHVFLVEKCRLWGSWDVEWCVRVDDIMAVPHIAANKLVFKVRQDESFDFFSGDERYVESEDTSVLEWLQSNIETVMILNMEDKPCPGEV
uniref:Intermembrane lipid transfer protein VPS13-like C-terminal domain-containing protein n=1 Tax=Timema shepardi TaxID=629360 RepID=A0A7R9AVS2_TIMSH|nr:unnamed protein product [Timema shepardi]